MTIPRPVQGLFFFTPVFIFEDQILATLFWLHNWIDDKKEREKKDSS